MNESLNEKKPDFLSSRQITLIEIFLITAFAVIPLFVNLPYRVNIFLSWEGAYRLSLGQIPYKDFGLPMGFAFWIIPAIFFKIFGPYMITLIKAQVLISLISGLSFRAILKNIGVSPGLRLVALLVYLISFSFFNFWPWYDQAVIVYEIIGLSFITKFIFSETSKYRLLWMFLGCFFLFVSFFTKQDGGGLAFLLALALISYNAFLEKKYLQIAYFVGFYLLIALAVILPFTRYNFGYWFNYGQPPHNSRLSLFDIIDLFFGQSDWLKFYLFIIMLLIIGKIRSWKYYLFDKQKMIFLLLVLGILAEAAIFQVTSYTPPDNNIFFHSFAIALILFLLNRYIHLRYEKLTILFVAVVFVMLWWSGSYWKYINRIVKRALPLKENIDSNEVSIHTYMLDANDTTNADMTKWVFCELPVFRKIYMPMGTADGIHRLMNSKIVQQHPEGMKLLNMSELTPLEYALHSKLETGEDYPLWYHENVGMFKEQTDNFIDKIKHNHYDLVLFEYIPGLNNFYPFVVRDSLKKYYKQVDSFDAPRRASYSIVEVYERKDGPDEQLQ